MSEINLTWEFPEEPEGTKGYGFKDAGIAHFSANRDSALFRECLQNSLDASADEKNGVLVAIEMKELSAKLIGAESLAKTIDQSNKSKYNSGDGRSLFLEAKKLLLKKTIPTLSLTDVHTFGAPDASKDEDRVSTWEAMTNSVGHSVKPNRGVGILGSFGLGKHAPFAATPLQTVLYSTCYENTNNDGGQSKRFIGRSILVTYFDENGIQHSRDGYLGDRYNPLKNQDIPDLFQMNTPGTRVWIPGYRAEINEDGQTWEDRALNAAVDNFFFAIVHGKLELLIGEDLAVDKNSLNPDGEYWHRVVNEKTKSYIKVAAQEPVAKQYIQEMGDIELRIEVGKIGEKQDKRALALVRHPGLMLTDMAQNLGPANPTIPRNWHPFTAVVTCVPREKDWVLQECEPPSHDHLSVAQIPETNLERRKKAISALKELKEYLYEKIKERAEPLYDGISDDASELEEIGLAIEDLNSNETLKLSSLEIVNRAPRDDRIRHKSESDETGEDTEVDDEDGIEQPAPEGGQGGGGDQPGTGVNEKPINTIKTDRNDLQPFFLTAFDAQGREESHQLKILFVPPKLNNAKKLLIELLAIGENEGRYRITIMEAKCNNIDLQFNMNIFEIPASLVDNKQVEVSLTLNEELGSSTFSLRYDLA